MDKGEIITIKEASLPLRDRLALERTVLANKRTMLAFVRTAIALFTGGLALVKIVDIVSFIAIGWVFMIASPAFFVAGIAIYSETRRRLKIDIDIAVDGIKKN